MQALSAINLEEFQPSEIARQTGQAGPSLELRPASSQKTRRLELTDQLARTFLNRGEEMDEVRLDEYSKALIEEFDDDSDTLAVLVKLARSRRAEYEPKIVELGELLARIRELGRERRRKAASKSTIDEFDAMKAQWERERAEDIANGIPRGSATDEWMKEVQAAAAPPRRPSLSGWTAEELRAAADALDAGKEVEMPMARDGYAIAEEIRKRYGITREQQEAAVARVLANGGEAR